MWFREYCQGSVIFHSESMKFTIFFFLFWLLVKFHWCVNFASFCFWSWHFSADVDKDVYISYTAVAIIVNQVFLADFRWQFNLVIKWITQNYIAANWDFNKNVFISWNTSKWILKKISLKTMHFRRLLRYDNFNNKNSSCKSEKKKNAEMFTLKLFFSL